MAKQEISADNFRYIIINGKLRNPHTPFIDQAGNVVIEEYSVQDSISITPEQHNGSDGTARNIIIKNCDFRADFSIEYFQKIASLRFIGCTFHGQVSFKDSKGIIRIVEKSKLYKGITVDNASIREFEVSNSSVSGPIILSGSFKHLLCLKNINQDEGILPVDLLEFRGSEIYKCIIENVTVNKLQAIAASRFLHDVIFENVRAGDILFNDAGIGLIVNMRNIICDSLIVDNIVKDNKPHRHLRLSNKCHIKDASFALEMLDNTRITDCEFGKLRIWGTNPDSSVFVIEQVEFSIFLFDEVYNKGSISCRELRRKDQVAQIIINSCNLGKTDFIQCHFERDILRFRHSKIAEIFISDSDFPKLVYMMDKDEKDYIQAKLAFGQLHTVYTKQGDTVQSLEYQSREIGVHFKVINWVVKRWPLFNFTKLNLALNWLSNYYGRGWVQGAIFSFGVGLLFFTFLLLSTGLFEWGFPDSSTWTLIPSYLKFMNPIRFFDLENLIKSSESLGTIELNNWSHVWDFFGRVFVAYGFYQTIQAFRRYGRK